ncbi:hypothetical protein [Actinocrispum wychmicini]|uniref:Uncharacterized protein n=1 Tax=Actinocrispum wychmicini TaxID=1213861 RepID=A0A4R2J2Z0_9PSEU|nr:hypothetical protein [Actinocrispum wychmicini]TCO52811.1 hypothetical protein EV192_1115 [Actinocrispum wychmicini]
MTTPAVARRGFTLALPEGFIELPVDEEDFDIPEVRSTLVAKMAALFGLDPDSEYAAATAAAYSAIGLTAGQGMDYAAVALYRSPDDPTRPIMITLTCTTMPSEHHTVPAAVEGLLEVHESQAKGVPARHRLPIGPAVTLVTEDPQALEYEGESVPILSRQVSLWVPDPDGTTVGVVAVQTNSWQDWEHVCVVAVDIFDSFEWQPLDES